MSKSGTIQASVAAIAGIAVVVWLHVSIFNKTETTLSDYTSDKVENTNVSADVIGEAIKSLNGTCPRQVDAETRLDSAEYLSGNIFAEYFTLINSERTSIDTATIKSRITEAIINNIKTNPSFASFKEYKVTFGFIYKDKNREPVCTVIITPEQYND